MRSPILVLFLKLSQHKIMNMDGEHADEKKNIIFIIFFKFFITLKIYASIFVKIYLRSYLKLAIFIYVSASL